MRIDPCLTTARARGREPLGTWLVPARARVGSGDLKSCCPCVCVWGVYVMDLIVTEGTVSSMYMQELGTFEFVIQIHVKT